MSSFTTINQNEVNAIAWKACDTFRGVVDPAEYKNYILVMLFVKYLSDVWQDHYEQYEKELKGDKELVKRKMSRERFIMPEHSHFSYLYSQRDESNIGEIINTALDDIEEHNKAKLDGVFRSIDFNSTSNLGDTKERNKRLKTLLEDFNDPKLNLRPSRIGNQDVIGSTYEYLIGRFASDSGKKGGEFYTPQGVAELLAELLEAKPGERISDPACGSGSLLIRAARQVGSRNFSLYGQESNGSTWSLCKMNMFLHDIDDSRIEWGDTIRNPKLIEDDGLMKFNVVVANPPFSLDKWGADDVSKDKHNRFYRGVPPKSKGDYAFITHMIETAVEGNGRVGVVVPHGVLFRGSSEGKIRQKFIEENLLDAVIGLPSNLFFGTGIPAAILIFNKGKQDTNVIFIDSSREYEEGKNQNKLREQDIEKIVKTFKSRESLDKYSYLASFDEIKENDFNLNIPRYVDTFEEEEEIDLKAVQKEIEQLEIELSKVREQMSGYLKELGL